MSLANDTKLKFRDQEIDLGERIGPRTVVSDFVGPVPIGQLVGRHLIFVVSASLSTPLTVFTRNSAISSPSGWVK